MSNQKHDIAEFIRLAKHHTSAQIANITGGNESHIRKILKQNGLKPKAAYDYDVGASAEQIDKNIKEYVEKVMPPNHVIIKKASEAELSRIFANVKPMKDDTIYRWRVDTMPILPEKHVYRANDFGFSELIVRHGDVFDT